MSETASSILASIAISIPFILLGIVTERWFEKNGYAPDRKVAIIGGVLLGVILKQIGLPNLSWWIYGPVLFLAMTLGIHRGDLWITMEKGRFWWKTKSTDPEGN